MHIQWNTVVVLLAAVSVTAMDAAEKPGIDVRIGDGLGPSRSLNLNKELVADIFQSIGIQIHWQKENQVQAAATDGRPVFQISLIGRAPASATSDALASTRLSEGTITVYEDRLRKRLSRAHPGAAKVALAYVFAHELAHALQGIARHSETGILKAHWSNDDFTAMLFRKLTFTDSDVDLIRKGLALRQSHHQRVGSPEPAD